MTSKWDFHGRSVDLTDKTNLVIIDFDNTRAEPFNAPLIYSIQ